MIRRLFCLYFFPFSTIVPLQECHADPLKIEQAAPPIKWEIVPFDFLLAFSLNCLNFIIGSGRFFFLPFIGSRQNEQKRVEAADFVDSFLCWGADRSPHFPLFASLIKEENEGGKGGKKPASHLPGSWRKDWLKKTSVS